MIRLPEDTNVVETIFIEELNSLLIGAVSLHLVARKCLACEVMIECTQLSHFTDAYRSLVCL